MGEVASTIIIIMAAAWFIQYGLSFFQLKRFYRRLYQLRKFGSVWVGKEGSAWKGRQYAVVVVDKQKRIAKVEQLSGWTIWASLKPVEGLEGRPVSDLLDESVALPVPRKLALALRNAATYIQEAEQRAAEKEQEQAEAEAGASIELGEIQAS